MIIPPEEENHPAGRTELGNTPPAYFGNSFVVESRWRAALAVAFVDPGASI